MTTTNQKPFQLGSVSTGTLRPEDLLPVFAATLDSFKTVAHQFTLEATMVLESNQEGYPDLLLDHLTEALQELCPPFVYFGTLEGDGADFGFWPDMDAIDEIRLGQSPSDFQAGHIYRLDDCILHINSNGDPTVMDLDRHVIWSTV